jgi:hypothetical protein
MVLPHSKVGTIALSMDVVQAFLLEHSTAAYTEDMLDTLIHQVQESFLVEYLKGCRKESISVGRYR